MNLALLLFHLCKYSTHELRFSIDIIIRNGELNGNQKHILERQQTIAESEFMLREIQEEAELKNFDLYSENYSLMINKPLKQSIIYIWIGTGRKSIFLF